MTPTDYSKIADQYDQNQVRHQIPRDQYLDRQLSQWTVNPSTSHFNVLDLACGTGNWLKVQMQEFPDSSIQWHGLDASEDMLEVARDKVNQVCFTQGTAEQLPFEDRSFNYINTHFAFHHFPDKIKALTEIKRVLHPGGTMKIWNISPHHMKDMWCYRFFPETWWEDLKRFWDPSILFYELEKLGFTVSLETHITRERVSLARCLAQAENRDLSELHLISEEAYQSGLELMRAETKKDPYCSLVQDLALILCVGDLNTL